ncbi:interleukin-15 isoform X4 [Puntigrus tetrazona]|uniref:interleukin-15 isoform X4 n=1 Tax=Puntigrus tetrazona TaxID=1606681 RepID=UPI001C8923B9|nr:interleukin-15 isoform X4 [Puntigrus tetrazona]
MIYSKDFYLTRTCEFHAAVAVGLPTISLSMILVTLFLALTAGLWNKPTRLKSMRTGRCACNLWCFENRMECPLNSERSNASLYTPNTEDINICTYKFFDCFLMEMNVLLHDEDPTDENKLKLMLERTLEEYNQKKCSERHPCELQELAPSNKFWEKMTNFLQKQQTLCRNTSTKTCD